VALQHFEGSSYSETHKRTKIPRHLRASPTVEETSGGLYA